MHCVTKRKAWNDLCPITAAYDHDIEMCFRANSDYFRMWR